MAAFEDHFDGADLDPTVWFPHYLPAWSSRAQSAASYAVADSCLTLTIPPDQGLWCPGDHTPPLRVSGIQSANRSGPVGSTDGQQPFRADQTVREEQPTFIGWTPSGGLVEMRARMDLSPRSMAALWMSGLEEEPAESGEICVAEVFGKAVGPGESAEVGMGLRAFRDPQVRGDFAAPRLRLDVAQFHTYGVDWSAQEATFLVDGEVVRTVPSPPTYPLQLMVAVFDFPDDSVGDDDHLVPALVVDYLRGS
jgi:hypothetical protein